MPPLSALQAAFCAMLMAAPPALASGSAPLEDLLRQGRVSLAATGTGQHTGEAVRVVVRNTGPAPLRVRIPVGWVFTSVDEGTQDLLVVRAEELGLPGGASRAVLCRALCTQAPLRGPSDGEPYRAGGMGSHALVAVARAIAAGDYAESVAQAAVWVLSDGYPIAGMGAMDSTPTDTLRLAVGRLSGQPPPRYAVRFADEPGSVCTGRPEAIIRRFSVDAPAGARFTAVVVDAAGHIVWALEERTALPPGRHERRFEVPVLGWPPGRYAIHARTETGAGVHRLPFTL